MCRLCFNRWQIFIRVHRAGSQGCSRGYEFFFTGIQDQRQHHSHPSVAAISAKNVKQKPAQ